MRFYGFIDKAKALWDILKVVLCIPVGYLLYHKRDIYLLCERGTDARDNGFHMFKYMTENHPDKDVYYIIEKHSADYPKVARLGRIIPYKSWKHAVYFVAAKKKISSHYMGYAPGTPYRFQRIRRFLKIPGKHILLQHGVIANDLIGLHADQTNIDLFICGAKPEYEYIRENWGYSEGVVRYTGLARYDALHDVTTTEDILVMPTWRKYLSDLSAEEFMHSDYYKCWNELLTNPCLMDMLKENGLRLVFYPHYEMQKFVECFHAANENVVIASFDAFDVQTLLKNAKLLITDYSSVFFDFAYMKKPCIYYQFDREEFFSQHYRKGYFNPQTDGFGKVAVNIEELLAALKHSMELDFLLEKDYAERIDNFFVLRDAHNCERIYNAIEELKHE